MRRLGRYAAALSSTQFNNETIVALYRFAFLLEGDGKAAERTLVSTLARCSSQVEQIRNEKNRLVFLVRKLRESCLKTSGSEKAAGDGCGSGDGEAFGRGFSTMPEPERSALALFYLDLFPVREIASLLGLSFDDFSDALERGREFLRRSHVIAATEEPA